MEFDPRSELISISNDDAAACVLDLEKGLVLLIKAIEACRRRNEGRPRSAALLAVSIDNMQSVTDLFGPHVTEPVFTGLASRIKECLRSSDLIARLSKNQLGVVLPYFRFNGAAVVIKRILALRAKPTLATHFGTVDLKFSVGSVFFPDPNLATADIIIRAQAAVAHERTENQRAVELTRSVREQVNTLRSA